MKPAALLLLASISALAQAPPFVYSYRTTASTASTPLSANGTITFPATLPGSSSSIFLSITNQSTSTWRILDVLISANSTQSSFTGSASNVTIAAGGTYSFALNFTPAVTGQSTAFLTVRYLSSAAFATQELFSLAGSTTSQTIPGPVDASAIVVSYVFPDRGNNIALSSGETIPFPSIGAGSRLSVIIVFTNRGSFTATVNAVTLTGAGFELTGLPLMPVSIIAGGETRFNVAFAPSEGRSYTGELRVTVGQLSRVFMLSGQGTLGQLQYELLSDGVPLRITSGSALIFPNVPAGTGSSQLAVRVRNSGNGETRLSGLSLSGTGFLLLDQPVPPIVIKTGDDLTIRIRFTPTDVGEYTGQLRIDDATFPVSGRGTGSRLTTWLLLGEDRFLLRTSSRGVIPNTDVGGRRQFTVEIANSGDEPAPILAIQMSGDGFNLSPLPPLPTRIPPGQSLLLTGSFAPSQVGAVIGFLTIQDLSFQILGVANDPPPLPPVKFIGLPESPQPLQQPPLALELESPYPYDLTGTLRLSFANDAYLDDPAIQFLNGQRTVEFRIPAGSTRSLFGSNAQEIRLQTGSLTGTITIVAQVATSKFDLTRSSPPVAVLSLPPSAPVIRTIEFIAKASRSFELVITGAVTTRTLSRFTFKFATKPGAKLQNTTVTADVARNFDTWFQSAYSRQFGGLFRASLVFDLTADFGAIDTIEVTAVNGVGTSAPRLVKVGTDK